MRCRPGGVLAFCGSSLCPLKGGVSPDRPPSAGLTRFGSAAIGHMSTNASHQVRRTHVSLMGITAHGAGLRVCVPGFTCHCKLTNGPQLCDPCTRVGTRGFARSAAVQTSCETRGSKHTAIVGQLPEVLHHAIHSAKGTEELNELQLQLESVGFGNFGGCEVARCSGKYISNPRRTIFDTVTFRSRIVGT